MESITYGFSYIALGLLVGKRAISCWHSSYLDAFCASLHSTIFVVPFAGTKAGTLSLRAATMLRQLVRLCLRSPVLPLVPAEIWMFSSWLEWISRYQFRQLVLRSMHRLQMSDPSKPFLSAPMICITWHNFTIHLSPGADKSIRGEWNLSWCRSYRAHFAVKIAVCLVCSSKQMRSKVSAVLLAQLWIPHFKRLNSIWRTRFSHAVRVAFILR